MPENTLSYILCFNARTGGRVLGEALRATGVAGIPDEWFNTASTGGNEDYWAKQWGITPPSVTGVYTEYLQKMHQHATSANGVFGLRCQFDDFELVPGKLKTIPEFTGGALPSIMNKAFPNLRYIWLRRRDRLRQAVSYARAMQSGLLNMQVGTAPQLLPAPVDFDVYELAHYDALFKEKDRYFVDYFKLSQVEPITVYYEDLLENYEGTIRRLLVELGVKGASSLQIAPSKCVRLSDEISEEWIRRYHAETKATADAAQTGAQGSQSAIVSSSSQAAVPPKKATAPMRDISEDLFKKRHALAIIQRQLANLDPKNKTIERRSNLTRSEFLEQYYARNRPVVLCDMMHDWKAMTLWTPEYLKRVCGDVMVDVQADRNNNPSYELQDGKHRKRVRFGDFVDMVEEGGATNDYYLTARDEFFKTPDVLHLLNDMVMFPEYLNSQERWMFMWYGPKGTYTPLHHDTMNIFMAQVKGRKNIKLVASTEMDLVYNYYGVYSNIDLDNPDYERYPKLRDATVLDVVLDAGEVLFLPAGWWHQVRSLDMSVTVTFMNFVFPNRFDWVHPDLRHELSPAS